jgi:GTP-binding protein
MGKPIVAIVGIPNVGKSTLFNRIVGKRIAVVEDIPGLTRDRIYGEARWNDKPFMVIDTGGFQVGRDRAREDIVEEVKKQAITAIEEADVVLMLMDAKKGLVPSDVELSKTLRKYNKIIFYAVNKIDGPKKDKDLYEYYSLGTELFPLSAVTGYGYEDLMDRIASELYDGTEEVDAGFPKIAIVGRPNVGKSTFVNALLGKERMIVSSRPGTTRDSIDSICRYYQKKYMIVDTAGIRKKGKMSVSYERHSFIRTLKNIESCDVALLLLDAQDGVVEMDQKVAGLVYEAGKGCIILVNKWDLLEKNPLSDREFNKLIQKKLWFMNYAPVLTVSALSRQRITKVFPLIDEVVVETSRRITTNALNNLLKKSLLIRRPPLYKGRRVKFSYLTQVGIKPQRFVLFTNRIEGVKPDYVRFLEKQLREGFSFKGVPVRIYLRQKKEKRTMKKVT